MFVTVTTYRHHSLMTPIDWKLSELLAHVLGKVFGHHSLMTPIDWKRLNPLAKEWCAN